MRKMKKFAEGGKAERGQARYDRMVADIESDYKKAQGRKTGRGAEVARAKYEQRMADAKDDLAKARGEDRSKTRAAESAAERELTMTRRYGARKTPAMEDTGPITRPMSTEAISAAVSATKPETKKPARRTAAPAARTNASTTRGAPPTTTRREVIPETRDNREIVVTGKKRVRGGPEDPSGPAARRARMGNAMLAPVKFLAENNPLSWAGRAIFDGEPSKPKPAAPKPRTFTQGQQAKLEELRRAAEAPGASTYAKDRYRMAKTSGMVGAKKGGSVKGYAKGGRIDGCAVRGKTKAGRK